MPTFHHANLGLPPGGVPAMHAFLVDLLGYRPIQAPAELAGEFYWFVADDGTEVHLSQDSDHRPAARAHLAVVLGDRFDATVARLEAGGHAVELLPVVPGRSARVGNCQDPAGNRWELRDS